MCAAKFIEGFTMLLASSCKRWRCGHVAYVGGWEVNAGFYTQSFFFLEPQTTKDSLGLSSVSPPTQRGYLTVKYHGLTPETQLFPSLGTTGYYCLLIFIVIIQIHVSVPYWDIHQPLY